MLQLTQEPHIILQQDRSYIGIRVSAPYSNMFSVVDIKFKQLKDYLKANNVINQGPFFLRYCVINMAGEMELEVGVIGHYNNHEEIDIKKGVLPGGLYATLIYKGLGLAANKHLLNWIEQNNHIIQKQSHKYGDDFACRYEAYLTDQKIEPRKKQWDIELSIKIIS
jgi:effector-binding domain-containing protein